jgi:hypothetical protein
VPPAPEGRDGSPEIRRVVASRKQRRRKQPHEGDRATAPRIEHVVSDRQAVDATHALRKLLRGDGGTNERQVGLDRTKAKTSAVAQIVNAPANQHLGWRGLRARRWHYPEHLKTCHELLGWQCAPGGLSRADAIAEREAPAQRPQGPRPAAAPLASSEWRVQWLAACRPATSSSTRPLRELRGIPSGGHRDRGETADPRIRTVNMACRPSFLWRRRHSGEATGPRRVRAARRRRSRSDRQSRRADAA